MFRGAGHACLLCWCLFVRGVRAVSEKATVGVAIQKNGRNSFEQTRVKVEVQDAAGAFSPTGGVCCLTKVHKSVVPRKLTHRIE